MNEVNEMNRLNEFNNSKINFYNMFRSNSDFDNYVFITTLGLCAMDVDND